MLLKQLYVNLLNRLLNKKLLEDYRPSGGADGATTGRSYRPGAGNTYRSAQYNSHAGYSPATSYYTNTGRTSHHGWGTIFPAEQYADYQYSHHTVGRYACSTACCSGTCPGSGSGRYPARARW